MKYHRSRSVRSIVLLFSTASLAACSFFSTPSATPLPSPTRQAGPSVTASFTPSVPAPSPTQTPTVAPTPIPRPIGFANAADLQILREYQNFDQSVEVFSTAISPDGRLAAMAGCQIEDDDQCHVTTYFRLFDASTGEALFDPEYLSPAIELLAFSPDGRVLAAAGCDISLYIYGEMDTVCDIPRTWLVSTETGEIIAELKGYTSHVTDFAFSPDGSTLFTSVVYNRNSGDGDHVIRVYNAQTGEKLATVETGMISCTEMFLDMSPDGRYLVANVTSPCEKQSFVAWWDVQDPAHPRQVGNVDSFSRFRVSPDSTQILLNNPKDDTLMQYDLVTGNSIKLIPRVPLQHRLSTFDYLRDRNTILLNVDYEYDVVDLTSGQVIRRITPQSGQYVGPYLLTPDHSTLFVAPITNHLAVEVWDLASWQSYSVQFDPNYAWMWQTSFGTNSVVFSSDQTWLLAIDASYGSLKAQLWGFAAPAQEQASQALRHYFDLLSNGEYQEALQMYVPYADISAELGPYTNLYAYYSTNDLQDLIPEVDVTDMLGLVTLLCEDQGFPCMPIKDVIYESQIWDNLYRLTVTFAGPDGELADWPLCRNVPAARWCMHRNGDFDFHVLQRPDGSFQVVDGLPPAIDLRLEQ